MKKAWHQPKIQLLDARATAVFSRRVNNRGNAGNYSTDEDAFAGDPNHRGDLGESRGETSGSLGYVPPGPPTTRQTQGYGPHPQYDNGGGFGTHAS